MLTAVPAVFAQKTDEERDLYALSDTVTIKDSYLEEYLRESSGKKRVRKERTRPQREHVSIFRYLRDSVYRRHFAAGKLKTLKEQEMTAAIRLPGETLAERDLNSIARFD